MYLANHKERVDRFLRERLGSGRVPETLQKAMCYSLEAGGKRIRPVLLLAACEAVGGEVEAALPTACAMELIHTFSLIHDDLPAMDDDDLRRGRPTNHKIFGEGKAILAGDALLAEAFVWLSDPSLVPGLPPDLRLSVLREIASAGGAEGMVGGQMLDLEGEGRTLTEAELEKIHRYKTGALIRAAVVCGGKIGGASSDTLRALEAYGENAGLAFQVADDLLNVGGDPGLLGKKTGSDALRRKATYPAVLGENGARRKAGELLEKALAALEPLDVKADPLREIARYIVQRRQ